MNFEDIVIVDLDLSKTTWSRVHSSMRTLYLRLSREPETGWVRFFHEERESRVMLKRHGFWIEEGYIVFDCLLDDVENHHLPDFRLSVAYANQRYREYLAQRHEENELLRDDARNERIELAALRDLVRGSESPPATPAQANGAAPKDATPKTISTAAAAPKPAAPPSATSGDAGFDAKREEWRARFRAALAARPKEPDRGND